MRLSTLVADRGFLAGGNERSVRLVFLGVELVVVLVCVAFSSFLAASVVSLLAYTALLVYLVAFEDRFFFKYIWCLLFCVLQILGVACIEFSTIELPELVTSSHFEGSLPAIVLLRFLLVAFILLLDDRIERKCKDIGEGRRIPFERHLPVACLLFFAVVFAALALTTQPALLGGVDRFGFYRNAGSLGGLVEVFRRSFPLVVICIAAWAHSRGRGKWVGLAATVVYLLVQIWMGGKFSELVGVLAVVILAQIDSIEEALKVNKGRILGVSAAVLLAIIVSAVVFQTTLEHFDAPHYVSARAAQQGQMWWMTYSKTDCPHPNELMDELVGQITNDPAAESNIGSGYGLYKIMYLCAPSHMVNAKLGLGTTYSEMGFALYYYYGGIVGGVLFSLACAVLMAVTTNLMAAFMARGHYVETALLARFYVAGNALMGTGSIHFLFSKATIVSYVLFVAVLLYRHRGLSNERVGEHARNAQ